MFTAISSKITLAALLAVTQPFAIADDSAAVIAAGGLVPRRETRIVMAKEALRISEKKVIVDYDFRNDTDENVTTEVAFPVSPYEDSPNGPSISNEFFSDFHLTIDGKTAPFKAEAKATLNGKDVTSILVADRIDIQSFGHLQYPPGTATGNRIPDLSHLPRAEQNRLARIGLFFVDKDGADATMIAIRKVFISTLLSEAHVFRVAFRAGMRIA